MKMSVYQHPKENRTYFPPDREPSLNLSVPVAHIAGLNDYLRGLPLHAAYADHSGTTAGNYTFAVTGADSANSLITASANVTITVQ